MLTNTLSFSRLLSACAVGANTPMTAAARKDAIAQRPALAPRHMWPPRFCGEKYFAKNKMDYAFRRMELKPFALWLAALSCLGGAVAGTPISSADAVAYLVNVTVKPGYNFANADHALSYGRGVCDKIAQGRPYAQLVGDIKADFNTGDEFQASYLITQAANELCPAQIWQLRNSAAGYRAAPT